MLAEAIEHYVEPRDEPRLARRGELDPDLLERDAREDDRSGHRSAREGRPHPSISTIPLAPSRRMMSEGDQRGASQREPDRIKGERADVVHADPLRDEREAPDDRCEHQKAFGSELALFHLSSVRELFFSG